MQIIIVWTSYYNILHLLIETIDTYTTFIHFQIR